MTTWTEPQAVAAAPDDASLRAGRKLAVASSWTELGRTDTLVWGFCAGSGRTPYQVAVDLTGPVAKCTCPSRKFPCKHGIALMLLTAAADVPLVDEPAEYAAAWAHGRALRAERAAAKAAAGDEGARPDPAAQAKRRDARVATMDAGISTFRTWLVDLSRAGFAAARAQRPAWWEGTAARLVDAKLPGLAERVRALPPTLRGNDWEANLRAGIAGLWLLVEAWPRRDELPADVAADLFVDLGRLIPSDEVRSRERLEGEWTALGSVVERAGRVDVRRSWLRADDGEFLVRIDALTPGATPEPTPPSGLRLHGIAARYPGTAPRRVLFHESPTPVAVATGLGPGESVADALAGTAAALAGAPWRTRRGVVLTAVRPTSRTDACVLVDAHGDAVRLHHGTDVASLVLRTGGASFDVFGELDGDELRPLAIAVDGEVSGL